MASDICCNRTRWLRILSGVRFSVLLLLSLGLFSAFAPAQGKSYPKPQTASAPGEKAPDFTLKDQNGNPFTLSKQQGAWMLLYFYRGYW